MVRTARLLRTQLCGVFIGGPGVCAVIARPRQIQHRLLLGQDPIQGEPLVPFAVT